MVFPATAADKMTWSQSGLVPVTADARGSILLPGASSGDQQTEVQQGQPSTALLANHRNPTPAYTASGWVAQADCSVQSYDACAAHYATTAAPAVQAAGLGTSSLQPENVLVGPPLIARAGTSYNNLSQVAPAPYGWMSAESHQTTNPQSAAAPLLPLPAAVHG